MSPLSTPDDSKFHSRTAASRNNRLNLSDTQRGITKANSSRAAEALVLRAAKMSQILIHRVIHSVINLIKQTQGTNLPSVLETTKLTLTQLFCTPNNTIQQTQIRLPQRHSFGSTMLQAGQNICIETALKYTWTIK